jgi:tRNA pseudouridine38-40 synthase
MPRFFIEVAYKGTQFKGFQSQENGITIQGEINKALSIICKENIISTTSSRTDSGVHAKQNFLHFDVTNALPKTICYSLNSILHKDIVVKNIFHVPNNAHARFDATGREYEYIICQEKNPFYRDTSFFYPFKLNIGLMNEAMPVFLANRDFTSFAKRHSDVNNHNCVLQKASWLQDSNGLIHFNVASNRFLRGMVRALVATTLQLGRNAISIEEFKQIIVAKDCTKADFSAAAHGLFLNNVNYPEALFNQKINMASI